jgi:hypothetical protein
MADRSHHVDPGDEPRVSPHEERGEAGEPPTSQLLERLRKHVLEISRYKLQGEPR